MLYIGGYGPKKRTYIVIDTDDGIEQVATESEIQTCVRQYGLEIKGVKMSEDGARIAGIGIYEDALPRMLKAEKFKVLYGVDIKVRDTTIVAIEIQRQPVKNLKLRLSDFGTSCGDNIIRREDIWSRPEPDVELILDDRVSVSEFSFQEMKRAGVRLNLVGFSSDILVPYIVREYSCKSYSTQVIDKFIIDRSDRMDYYRAKALVEHDLHPGVSSVSDVTVNTALVSERIAKEYLPEFKTLLDVKFRVRNVNNFISSCDSIAKWLQCGEAVSLLESRDYAAIKASRCFDILRISLNSIALSSPEYKSVERLQRYLYMFDADPKIQAIFIRYCTKWRSWLKKWSQQRGWLRFWA